MVKKCCVYECGEKYVKGGPVTFHCFPKDETRRRLWESQVNRENFKATDFTPICSKHFSADCFEREKWGGTWLKANAVPTIFEFPPDENETEDSQKIISAERVNIAKEYVNSHLKNLVKRKRCYYLGDFSESDMASPEKAAKVLGIAKEEKKKDIRRIKALKQRNRSLRKRIASLKQTLKEIKKNSSGTNSNSEIVPAEEKGHISLETSVRIKEEPMDFHPNQSPSTEITNEKFISPHQQNAWTLRDSVVEPQFTLSVACLAPPNVPKTSGDEQLEKTQPTFVPSTSEYTQQNSRASSGELSNPAFSNEPCKDQFQAFGEYVAAKLRSMDSKTSALAQKAIRDIILEAESGKYRIEKLRIPTNSWSIVPIQPLRFV